MEELLKIVEAMEYEAWNLILSIITIIASFVAIIISLQIADKQNKISLFEKRYELYNLSLHFLDCAYSFYIENDRWSISPIELTKLENDFDSAIDKSRFLFNEEISKILARGKDCFGCHIKYYKEAPNSKRQDAIKQNILDCKNDFIKESAKYLKL